MNEMKANHMSQNMMTSANYAPHLLGRDADAGLGGLGKVFQIGVRVIGIGRRLSKQNHKQGEFFFRGFYLGLGK